MKIRTHNRWSKEEISFLGINYKNMTAIELAKLMKRTEKSVQMQCVKINLKKSASMLAGQKYGLLTIIEESLNKRKNNKHGKVFLCKCDCGLIKEMRVDRIKKENSSCGCYGIKKRSLNFRKNSGDVTWNLLYRSYKTSAKEHNRVFSLSLDEFKDICSKNCFYCGINPKDFNYYLLADGKSFRNKRRIPSKDSIDRSWIKCSGIDRSDTKIGYELNNCLPCCKTCNYAKNAMSQTDFIEWLDQLCKFRSTM